MNVLRPDMGTGMTVDEVAALTEQADVDAVRAYRSAVGRRTRQVVGALRAQAWDETLGLPDTARAAATGAFGPNDEWVEGVGIARGKVIRGASSSATQPSGTTATTSAKR